MQIPKGLLYQFTTKVLEEDSFLPQDLTNLTNATFTVFEITEDSNGSTIATPKFLIDKDSGSGIGSYEKSSSFLITSDVTTEIVVETITEAYDGNDVLQSTNTVQTNGSSTNTKNTVSSIITGNDGILIVGPTVVEGTIVTSTPSGTGYHTKTITGRTTTTETTVTSSVSAKPGLITFTVSATSTDLLDPEVGAKEDGRYYKNMYRGTIVLNFSDRADMNVTIDNITPIFAGV